MKILTKNGFKFAVGMFWQIPDFGKKTVSLAKIAKDTGYDTYCITKSIGSTYGFCHKSALQCEKKVASLGKFIIEASKLTSEYAASIICYKFKERGEVDEDGKLLKEDLFGYLVLLNGTICPIEGEYVAEFDLVKNSVIEQAKLHPIDTLYLPIDVAEKFLNIFERLDYALHADDSGEVLLSIMRAATQLQAQELLAFIQEKFAGKNLPTRLINYLTKCATQIITAAVMSSDLDLAELRMVIASEAFRSKLREHLQVENNIRYLVANILQVPLSSNDIFWNTQLRQNHSKSLLQPISNQTVKKYTYMALAVFLGVCGYLSYSYFVSGNVPLTLQQPIQKVVAPKPIALPPSKLIELCLGHGNDRFFRDLGNWTLTGLKCNSLNVSYMFTANQDITLAIFAQFIGSKTGVQVNMRNGVYTRKFGGVMVANAGIDTLAVQSIPVKNITRASAVSVDEISNVLAQGAVNYAYKLTLSEVKNAKRSSSGAQPKMVNKFVMQSKVSPVFLLQHGILDLVQLESIEMKFDKNTGIYNWTIGGAF